MKFGEKEFKSNKRGDMRERESVCMRVCVYERERESVRESVCVTESVCMRERESGEMCAVYNMRNLERIYNVYK